MKITPHDLNISPGSLDPFLFDNGLPLYRTEKLPGGSLLIDDDHYYVSSRVVPFPGANLHKSLLMALILTQLGEKPVLGANLVQVIYRNATDDGGWKFYWRYRFYLDAKVWSSHDARVVLHVALPGVDEATPEQLAAAGFASRQDAVQRAADTILMLTSPAEDPHDKGELTLIRGGAAEFSEAMKHSHYGTTRQVAADWEKEEDPNHAE